MSRSTRAIYNMLQALLHYGPVQITSALAIFGLISIQVRYLGISDYGVLVVCVAIVDLFRMATSQWITMTLLRFYPAAVECEKERLVSFSSSLLFYLMPISIILLWFGLGFISFDSGSIQITLLFVSVFVVRSFLAYFQEVLRLSDNRKLYQRSMVAQSLLLISTSWGLLAFEPSIRSAVLALLLSYSIPLIIVFRPTRITSKFYQSSSARRFMNFGMPLLATSVLALLSSRVDRFVLVDLLSFDILGVYYAMINIISGIFSIVFMVIALPLYPELTRLVEDKGLLFKKHKQYISLLVVVSFPAFAGIMYVSEDLFLVMLGSEFKIDNFWTIFYVVIGCYFLNLKAHFLDHGINFSETTKILPYIVAIGLVINVIFVYLLVPSYGITGVAVSYFAMSVFVSFLTFILARKSGYSYPAPYDINRIFISVCIMLGVLISLEFIMGSLSLVWSLLLYVIVGVFSYLFSLYFMKVNFLRGLVSKMVNL